jgi:predicted transcriptional regulator
MAKRKQKKARLSVSVTEAQKDALQDMADQSEVSLARVIQQAIKEFLENHKDRRLPLFERPPPKG